MNKAIHKLNWKRRKKEGKNWWKMMKEEMKNEVGWEEEDEKHFAK